jgi:hypothetical protein
MPDETLTKLAATLDKPGIQVSNMFGKPSLKDENGKAFACLHAGKLACRLGRGTQPHADALALDGAHLFDPSGRDRPMKDWVSIPNTHSSRWPEFAAAALSTSR